MRVKSLTELRQLAEHAPDRSRVRDLSLRHPEVTDGFARFAASFPNLRSLDLSESQVTDDAVENLRDHPNLECLYLSKTKVGRKLDALATLPKLTELDLEEAAVTDSGLKAIGAVAGLTDLDISYGCYSDAGLRSLLGLSRLRSLRLGGNMHLSLHDYGEDEPEYGKRSAAGLLDAVSRLEALETLYIADEDFQKLDLEPLTRLPLLKTLVLYWILPEPEEAHSVLGVLTRCPSLTHLYVANEELTRKMVRSLQGNTLQVFAHGSSTLRGQNGTRRQARSLKAHPPAPVVFEDRALFEWNKGDL